MQMPLISKFFKAHNCSPFLFMPFPIRQQLLFNKYSLLNFPSFLFEIKLNISNDSLKDEEK